MLEAKVVCINYSNLSDQTADPIIRSTCSRFVAEVCKINIQRVLVQKARRKKWHNLPLHNLSLHNCEYIIYIDLWSVPYPPAVVLQWCRHLSSSQNHEWVISRLDHAFSKFTLLYFSGHVWRLWFVFRGLQRDVVYLGWPIAPRYMSPNVEGVGSCDASANEYNCTQQPKYTVGDLTPYLTFVCTHALSIFFFGGGGTQTDQIKKLVL